MKIGFIGLGVMGNPMAQNLQRSGHHQLCVFDIDPRRGDELERLGARRAASIGEAIAQAEDEHFAVYYREQLRRFLGERDADDRPDAPSPWHLFRVPRAPEDPGITV